MYNNINAILFILNIHYECVPGQVEPKPFFYTPSHLHTEIYIVLAMYVCYKQYSVAITNWKKFT